MKTIELLNQFLQKIQFNEKNYFSINDFNTNINHDIGIIYPNEEFVLAQKNQLIYNEGKTFRIYILCVVEKSNDQLYAISFGCKEINDDESMIIVEYIHNLIIQFSTFLNKQLYEGLKDHSRLDRIFLSTYIRLTQKIHETNSQEKQFIIDDYQIDRDYCKLDYNLYLSIFLHENGLLNYLLVFSKEESDA
ncbi:MAG: hypothetical protein LUG60_07045 [Erysipelotrichaceae bacterium]|nr:hypothetical protein [Erysipelotrichaceae bacterium]